jgi:hypothetical protein
MPATAAPADAANKRRRLTPGSAGEEPELAGCGTDESVMLYSYLLGATGMRRRGEFDRE